MTQLQQEITRYLTDRFQLTQQDITTITQQAIQETLAFQGSPAQKTREAKLRAIEIICGVNLNKPYPSVSVK